MAKLPFVVEPRHKPIIETIGTEESGSINIVRKGYLTTGEKAFMQQAMGVDETSVRIVSLSRKVANKHGLPLEDAYNIVVQILTRSGSLGDHTKDIEQEHFDDFSEVLGHLSAVQSKEQLLKALCMIMYRIDSDYNMQDIMELHPDIINGLVRLYDDEESRSISRLLTDDERMTTANDEANEDKASGFQAAEKKRGKRTTPVPE